ncbi:MAG: carbohydrate kinase [Ignavibacteria bacterium]|nr:carbohydrate kinase [Ignavibacteria bacterium]
MKTVICFGEVLWDSMPQGLFLGGAPLNVAYHLSRLGCEALMVSTVGDDVLGEEVLDRMKAFGLSTEHIAVSGALRTGLVKVQLDRAGNASYTIIDPAAWDKIDVPDDLVRKTSSAQALVFGSLAMRHEHNIHQLSRLLDLPGILKVFDVNLRPPFDNMDLVFALARRADVLKLNEEELSRLTGLESGTEGAVVDLARRSGVKRICVTLAARGALLYDNGQWFPGKAEPVEVRDTVGAGDAFLASFVLSMLSGRVDYSVEMAKACRLGAFIATQYGATPEYDPNVLPYTGMRTK